MTAVRPGTAHGRHRDASRPVSGVKDRVFSARSRPPAVALALIVVAVVVAALVLRVPPLRPDTAVGVATRESYYVNCDTGSDGAAGTTPGQAWRSLGNLARTFSASTAIYLARGCAWQGGIRLSGNGTDSAPIVLDAYGNGAAPHVGNADGDAFEQCHHPRRQLSNGADNLLITDGRAAGIRAEGAYGTVRNSEISSSGVGVETADSAHHARMLGNYVHDLHMVVDTPRERQPERCLRCRLLQRRVGRRGDRLQHGSELPGPQPRLRHRRRLRRGVQPW